MVNVLAGMQHVQNGFKEGQQRGELNRFRSLTEGAMGGDPNAIEQQYALDPQRAAQVQSGADITAKRARGAAKYLMEAVETGDPAQIQGRYNAVRPFLAKVGQQAGKVPPEQFDPTMVEGMQQLLAKTAYLDSAGADGMPAGFRQFQMTAEAAGLKPGTPEYQQAANIALGREGRAATGGYGFGTIEWGGRTVPTRTNPRDGSQELWDGAQWLPLGGAGAMGVPAPVTQQQMQSAPQAARQYTPAAGDQTAIIEQEIGRALTPQERAQIASGTLNLQVPASGQSAQGENLDFIPRMSNFTGPSGIGVSRTPEEQAALTAAAQEQVELGYLPQRQDIETQGALARARGEAEVKSQTQRAEEQRDNARTLAQYEAAMEGVAEGLGMSGTGPIMGRLPAMTAGQQISEGAVSAIAPVLKQLFRTAGEGTFTDKDQDLLMAMIPTRTDLPESRAWKMQNIDRIVREKLGVGNNIQTSDVVVPGGLSPGHEEDGYRFRGGDPADPANWERL